MGYRYLALLGDRQYDYGHARHAETALIEAGMSLRHASGAFKLFAAKETPILHLPNGGVLIGYLFRRDGTLVLDATQIPAFSRSEEVHRHLLNNFWGEYLLFQPIVGSPQRMTISRDPSGGVMCFYSLHEDAGFVTSHIAFATEAGLYRNKIDWDYITRFLTYPYQKTRRTGLSGVSELLPGCTVRVTAAEPITEQLWSPWDFVARQRRFTDALEAASNVRLTVASAIKAWANVDQSILLEMSGGLDSSIVAACLRDTPARIVCCTLVTPVPGADERQYASMVADNLGVELQTEVLKFEGARFSFALPSNTVSPRIGCLQYAINSTMSTVADHHDTGSFFTGAGGDSVFCYLTSASPAADAFKEHGLAAGFSAIRDLSALHHCTHWKAAWLTASKLLRPPKPLRSPHGTFVEPFHATTAAEDHPWFEAPADALPGDRERIAGLIDTQIFRDIAPRGTERWLRMPLLAQPAVEACLRTPSWMWIAGGQNRAVARMAFADVLPAEILNRRSKGNFVGYLGGFYRRNRIGIRDFLLSGHLHERRLLNAAALSAFLSREDLPTRDRLFLEVLELCTIENWVRHQSGERPD